jgi:hypothetical protein
VTAAIAAQAWDSTLGLMVALSVAAPLVAIVIFS